MKKKILIIAVLLIAVLAIFSMASTVKAETAKRAEVIKKDGGTSEQYDTLDEALKAANDGDTVKLLQSFTIENNENASQDPENGSGYIILNGNKQVTLNLDGKTITSINDNKNVTIVVDGGGHLIITGNGKVDGKKGRAILVVDGKVTIENGTFETTGDNGYGVIQVGKGSWSSVAKRENPKAALEIVNATINSNQKGAGIVVVEDSSTLDIKNVTIKDANISKAASEGVRGISIQGTNNTATIENCNIDVSGDGIFVGNGPNELTINGGTITAKSFAISGNGSKTTNSTITISGGTITSTGTAAIYHPNTGTLTVKGTATVKGKVGIVARQGTINIEGGKVIGTGTGSGQVGDATEDSEKVNIPFGAAIVVDNKSENYSNTAKVNISDGILNSVNEDTSPVISYQGKDNDNKQGKKTDFAITGGEFSSPFNAELITEGLAEVSIEKSGDARYYVGNTAKTAVKNAAAGSHVKVEHGILEIANLPSGVTFEGAVTVTNPSNSGDTVETIKNNLQALIAKAEGEENASAELTNEINTAKAVLANSGATYGELQQALANLQSAYDNFKGGNANENQGIVSGNESNTTGDKGKLDDEPKMGEGLTVFGVIAVCAVLMLVIKSRKNFRR